MPFLNIWDLLMVIGVGQGMIMAFVCWFRKGSHISARFLGVIFFTLALATLGTLISEKEPDPVTPLYLWLNRYVPFWPFMLLGPSLLFMIQSQLDRRFDFNRTKKIHYLAVLFNLIPSVAWISAWLRYKLDLVQYNRSEFLEFIHAFYTYGDIVYWLHLLAYTLLAKSYIRANQVNEELSKKLFQIVVSFQLLLVAWFPFLVLYVSRFENVLDPYSYYPVFIPVTILIYWLGFQWFFYLYKSRRTTKKSEIDERKMTQKFQAAIEDQLYLDPELTVKSAARTMNIPQRDLSIYINQYLNSSFTDLINGYRIEEVKRKLSDPTNDRYTIAAIALDSGFKSIATFQRAFKQVERVSPKKFKNQLKKNAQITI